VSTRVGSSENEDLTGEQPEPETEQETTSDQGQVKSAECSKKRVPLVVETAKLLQDAEYISKQQQRDEFFENENPSFWFGQGRLRDG